MMMMMLVIMRRNQARRNEGKNPSAWAVKSFDSIWSSRMKVILFILKKREVTRESQGSPEEIGGE